MAIAGKKIGASLKRRGTKDPPLDSPDRTPCHRRIVRWFAVSLPSISDIDISKQVDFTWAIIQVQAGAQPGVNTLGDAGQMRHRSNPGSGSFSKGY